MDTQPNVEYLPLETPLEVPIDSPLEVGQGSGGEYQQGDTDGQAG